MSNLSEEEAHHRAVCSRLTLQSVKEGFFRQLADSLASKVDFASFLKCSSDLERFKIVATSCWDHINAELIFRGKNAEVSVQKRLEGNKYFESNDFKKALLCYSQSLVQAPVGPEIISSFTNRSALLHKMGEYQAAIDDVELAISYGSPELSKHKLYERMTSCYISLKNYQKAKVTARLAKHLAEKHDPTNEKFLKKIEKYSATIEKASKGSKEVSSASSKTTKPSSLGQAENLPKGFTPGQVYTNASEKFNVDYHPDFGRYAVTTAKMGPGEVVLKERPFASCLNMEKMGSHCTHCLIRFKVPIPCETCTHVAFCSRACRKEAEAYHQYECKIMALLMGSGISANASLAFRIITQWPLEKFKEIFPDLQNDPSRVNLDENGKYDATSYLNIYNFGGLEHERTPVDFYERTLMAVFLVKCLRLNQYFQINLFKTPKPTQDEFMIGSLLLRNLQVMQFNAYSICEFLMESRSHYRKTTTSSVGIAIYPTASYFNHSCAPDVTRYFVGTTMFIQTIKSVDANKPIHDNYGPMFTKTGRDQRLKSLKSRWWFPCFCIACKEDWPLLATLPTEFDPKEGEEKKIIKKLMALDQKYFDDGMKAMEVGKPLAALEFFKSYVEEAEALLRLVPKYLPYKNLLLVQEGIKLCLCSLGTIFVSSD
ncbi:SET and MYND domain-containing protein 4 [Orchesella cincta]|uniref:SET and MYND domain-containing protein 4 n=1 Tax=Orchesella cincta TaxID=48709 RepID=A0A1D2NEZ8_ORCCI|nr:SET and MYND domain-containing protein 4 [Orchesella cincta]